MSSLDPQTRAVVRALDALTTQVQRLADAHTTTADAPTTTADDGCTRACHGVTGIRGLLEHVGIDTTGQDITVAGRVVDQAPAAEGPCAQHPHAPVIGGHCGGCTVYPTDMRPAPAADDEQTLRWARRESLLVLLTRVQRGRTLTEDEALTLRQHVETEMREAETARSVAAGNKRHVQTIVPEIDRIARENEQQRAELEKLRSVLEYEHKRANSAIDRETTAEQDAEEQRRRADIFATELNVLRCGLRANGADPTQIQNLWAQIRLRNRQWRDAKREREQAQAAIERVRALHRKASHGTTCVYCAHGQRLGYDTDWPCDTIRALDGTEQPTTEQPDENARLIAEYQAAILRVLALREPIAEALEQADYRQDMRRGDLADAIMPVIRAAVDVPAEASEAVTEELEG